MHAEIRIVNARIMLNDVMTGTGPKASPRARKISRHRKWNSAAQQR
jgi:hypothetical protein